MTGVTSEIANARHPLCPHGKPRLIKDDFYTGNGCEECREYKHRQRAELVRKVDCQGDAMARIDDTIIAAIKPGALGARKDDQGKPPVTRGCLHYFPHALAEVSKISAFGAKKYAWDGWRGVPDWEHRYPDALGRHLLASKGDLRATDPETGELEWAHLAWNALAVLEKILSDDTKAA